VTLSQMPHFLQRLRTQFIAETKRRQHRAITRQHGITRDGRFRPA